MSKIGISILATNCYFVLGLRFMKQFMYHYKGNNEIIFYFFSDKNVVEYINKDIINVKYIETHHDNWVNATNDKFKSIVKYENDLKQNVDYLFYFDADTSITRDFTDSWFMLGDLVGGEHFWNQYTDKNPFDRNKESKAYIPDDGNERMYYYGAFFGGNINYVIFFCKILIEWQTYDKEKLNYEPCFNDESYINKYFNTYPHETVLCKDFVPNISDKAGFSDNRNPNADWDPEVYIYLQNNIDTPFTFNNNKIVLYK